MRAILIGLAMLVCAVCNGQIVGPDNVDVGRKVVLKVAEDVDVNLIFWSIPKGIEYEATDNNRTLFIWGNVGTYDFILNAAKIDWESQTVIQIPQALHTLTIGTPEPPTPPDPDLEGVALECYQWGMSVDSEYRRYAVPLASNYMTVGKQLKNLELTVEQALQELRDNNNEVLDTQAKKDAWSSFGTKLQNKMQSSWPMNREIFAAFLADVGLGLSYVK